MNKKDTLIGILFILFLGASFVAYRSHEVRSISSHQNTESNTAEHNDSMQDSAKKHETAYHSPYVGQEDRRIKALSVDDIEGLKKGSGTPFNGLAKPAELNGVPGPKHVLDMIEAGKLDVTEGQLEQIQSIYNRMQEEAIALGDELLGVEREIDDGFKNKDVSEEDLQERIEASANLYADLRYAHLKTHLEMLNVLEEKQIEKYGELRGYADGGDPCENIPEGHDREMWLKNNGCQS